MNTQHTAGPWEIRPSSNSNNGAGWRDIVSTGGEFSPAYVGEALEQDARLIAAAPDLLAALRAYVELEESAAPYSSSPMREHARAAIAKATGNG